MQGIILFFALVYVTGILSLLFGRKIFHSLLAIYAFITAYQYASSFVSDSQYVLLISVLAGVLGVLLVRFAEKAAFFVIGAYFGYLLFGLLGVYIPFQNTYVYYGAMAAVMIVCGLLMIKYQNVLLRYATSFAGGHIIGAASLYLLMEGNNASAYAGADAVLAGSQLGQYIYGPFAQGHSLYILVIAVILMFAGAQYQRHHH